MGGIGASAHQGGIAMKLLRKIFCNCRGAAALPALSRLASAQAYPTRPVRCIVAMRGRGTDIFIRLMGQSLSERIGQPFVVENRAGAASNIATDRSYALPLTAIRCSGPMRPPPSTQRL